jgi:hypothetical protein
LIPPHGATWRSGYATVCKTVYTSSILVVASINIINLLCLISKKSLYPHATPSKTVAARFLDREDRRPARLSLKFRLADGPKHAWKITPCRGGRSRFFRQSVLLQTWPPHLPGCGGHFWIWSAASSIRRARMVSGTGYRYIPTACQSASGPSRPASSHYQQEAYQPSGNGIRGHAI